tara:strand:+ start:201 stop:803 length:603 start_codon:yes stop_codon:yes gene_type:complete
VLISHKYKFCYVHIPRTGGSWATYKLRDLDDTLKGSGKEIPLAHAHPTRYEYKKFGRHGRLEQMYEACDVNLDDYFKFAFVRHPYTRFQSAFTYFTDVMETAKRVGFVNYEQMMDWIEDTNASKLHVAPQCNWHDKRIDQYFKFENIEQISLEKYIKNIAYNKRSNPIMKTRYKTELDSNIKQRIYVFYKQDFELFDYQP